MNSGPHTCLACTLLTVVSVAPPLFLWLACNVPPTGFSFPYARVPAMCHQAGHVTAFLSLLRSEIMRSSRQSSLGQCLPAARWRLHSMTLNALLRASVYHEPAQSFCRSQHLHVFGDCLQSRIPSFMAVAFPCFYLLCGSFHTLSSA